MSFKEFSGELDKGFAEFTGELDAPDTGDDLARIAKRGRSNAVESTAKNLGVTPLAVEEVIAKADERVKANAAKNPKINQSALRDSLIDIGLEDAARRQQLESSGFLETVGGILSSPSDIPKTLGAGALNTAAGAMELMGNEYDARLARERASELSKSRSAAMQNELSPTAGVLDAVGQSLPGMALGVGVGGVVGKGLQTALGATRVGAGAAAAAEIAGSVGAKAPLAARAINAIPVVGGAALGEGGVSALGGANEAATEFDALRRKSPDTIRSSARYRELLSEYGTDAAAMDALRSEAINKGALYQGGATTVAGALIGSLIPGIDAKLVSRILGKDKSKDSGVVQVAKSTGGESVQEFGQSGLESIAGDVAASAFDPTKQIGETALFDASMGGIAGAVTGGAVQSVMTGADKMASIAAEREKLSALKSGTVQEIQQQSITNIGSATSVDEAIAAAGAAVSQNASEQADQLLNAAGIDTAPLKAPVTAPVSADLEAFVSGQIASETPAAASIEAVNTSTSTAETIAQKPLELKPGNPVTVGGEPLAGVVEYDTPMGRMAGPAPITRTVRDLKQDAAAVAELNQGTGLAGTDLESTLLPDVPDSGKQGSGAGAIRAVAAVAERVFGTRVTYVESADKFFGVAHKGRVFINANEVLGGDGQNSVAALAIATIGHEAGHAGFEQGSAADRAAGEKYLQAVQQYLKEDAIKSRVTKYAPTRDNAISETMRDVDGAMWLDSKFWGRLYDVDNGSTFRKIAYKFMQAATKFVTAAKGSRLDIDTLVTNVEAVREAAAQAWAAKAQGAKAVPRSKLKEDLFSADALLDDAPTYKRDDAQYLATGGQNEILTGRDGSVPADAGQNRSAPAGDGGDRPNYGQPREGAISVVGRHYSRGQRTSLSGLFYGQGLKGAESNRLEGASSQIRSRIYFYVDTGKGIRPESGVGGYAHEVRLDNIYDPSTKLVKHPGDANGFEEAVVKAGFDGYLLKDFTTTNGAVVLLGAKHGAVPVRYIQDAQGAPSPVSEAPSTIKKSLLSKEANAVNVDAIPGAKMRMGTLEVPVDQRDAANAEMERIGSAVRYSRSNFEVAPDPNNAELSGKWNVLPLQRKLEVSRMVAESIVPRVLYLAGATGKISDQFGSYLADTNPSFALTLDSGNVHDVSKKLGYVLSQDSMMNIALEPFDGSEEVGAVVIALGDKSFDEVKAIYDQIRAAVPEVGGQSYTDGIMTVLNYSDTPSEGLMEKIDAALSYEYHSSTQQVYASFPQKEEYDYGSQRDDTGNGGGLEEVVQQRLDSLRREATRIIASEVSYSRTDEYEDGFFEDDTEYNEDAVNLSADYADLDLESVVEDLNEPDFPGLVIPDNPLEGMTSPNTPEFRRWFGDSKWVNADGTPMVGFHGTAADIEAFRPKQAGMIFVAPDPKFSEQFADMSANWMREHYTQILTPKQVKEVRAKAAKEIMGIKEYPMSTSKAMKADLELDSPKGEVADILAPYIEAYMPSGENIIPVWVSAQNPFDYEKPGDVKLVVGKLKSLEGRIRITPAQGEQTWMKVGDLHRRLETGEWNLIESPEVMAVIKELGFDSIYVTEMGRKNIAVFKSSQIKSLFNRGTFDPQDDRISYSRAQLDAYMDGRNKSMPTISSASEQEADIALAVKAINAASSEISSGNRDSVPIPIGRTPHAMNLVGAPQKMLHIDARILKKVLFDKHSEDFADVDAETFVRALYQPAMILKGRSVQEMEIVTSLVTKRGPILVPVTDAGSSYAVMSAYAKNVGGSGESLVKRIKSGALLYADPELAQIAATGRSPIRGINTRGAQFPDAPPRLANKSNVADKDLAVKPLNPYYVGWAQLRDDILGGIRERKVKTDLDVMKRIGKLYKGDIKDAPSFSRAESWASNVLAGKKSDPGFVVAESPPLPMQMFGLGRSLPVAMQRNLVLHLRNSGKKDGVRAANVPQMVAAAASEISRPRAVISYMAEGTQRYEAILHWRDENQNPLLVSLRRGEFRAGSRSVFIANIRTLYSKNESMAYVLRHIKDGSKVWLDEEGVARVKDVTGGGQFPNTAETAAQPRTTNVAPLRRNGLEVSQATTSNVYGPRSLVKYSKGGSDWMLAKEDIRVTDADIKAVQGVAFSRSEETTPAERDSQISSKNAQAREALARIMKDGVTSPDDLRALLRVPGYSKWAKSTIAGDMESVAALRSELQQTFPGSDWKAPKLNDQGIITVYSDWSDLTNQNLDKLTRIADKYDAPIGVRGGAATQRLVSKLDGFGFEAYQGLQERADRMPNVMFGMLRPAGGITATTPLFSRNQGTQGQRFNIPGEIRGGKLDLAGRTAHARRIWQDYFLPVLTVQNAILGQGGIVTEVSDVYRAEERMHGRVEEAIRDFRTKHFDPMIEELQKAGLTPDELALYAYAKHAPERNAHIATIRPSMPDGGSGMTNAEAAAVIAQFQTEGKEADLARLHVDLMATTAATRREMLEQELITQEEFDALEGMFENYVPLRGLDEDVSTPIPRKGGGFNIRGKETMRALGRRSKAGDIIENIVSDYENTVARGEKNSVGKRFLQLVKDNPDPGLWEIDAVRTKAAWNNQTKTVGYRTKIESGPDTVAVKVNGKEVYIKIHDENLLRAMRRHYKTEMSGLERTVTTLFGGFNDILRASLTQYNPVFGFVNYARDIQMGAVGVLDELGSKAVGKFTKYQASSMATAHRYVNGKLDMSNPVDKMFEEFRAAGATTGGFYAKDVEHIRQEIRNVMLAAGAAPKGWVENVKVMGDRMVLKGVRGVGAILEHIGSVSENSTRFAAYRVAREMGKSPAEAASIAKNLTTNFNRKGEWGQTMNTAYLFFNAAMQGSHRVVKALKNRKVQGLMAGMTAAGAGLAMMAIAVGGDDEDDGQAYWDKIPAFEKERNFIIMLPPGDETVGAEKVGTNGRYLKIPMPYGFSVFPMLGYTIADVARNQADKTRGVSVAKGAVNMVSAVAGSFNPFGGAVDLSSPTGIGMAIAPTMADVVIQQASGRNSFDRPTAPFKSEFDLDPDSENVNPRQAGGIFHMLARGLNRATGGDQSKPGAIDVAPGTLENAVRTVTGGTGTFLTDVFVNLPTKLFDTSMGVDADISGRDFPIYRNFVGSVDGMSDASLLYERRRAILEARTVQKNYEKLGLDPEKMDSMDFALAYLAETSNYYSKALGAIKKQEIALQLDEEISRGDKRLQMKELRLQRDELTRSFNAAFMEVMRAERDGNFAVSK